MNGHFRQFYNVRASDLEPRADWLAEVDVADMDVLREDVSRYRPDLLVNLAARTDLEWCERHPEQTRRDNAVGARNCAALAESLGIPYVYIGTAGIFGGELEEYHDGDRPDPLTVYARTKYEGELAAVAHCTKAFVLRAGWMMGGGPQLDKKFVNKIYQQIRAGARVIHAVTDKRGTPTYTRNFAEGIEVVVSAGRPGVYNQVCGGRASRYDVACEFVRHLDVDVEVVGVDSGFFAEEYSARRPASEQLVNTRLTELGLNVMRDWRDCLAEYAAEFRADLARQRRPA